MTTFFCTLNGNTRATIKGVNFIIGIMFHYPYEGYSDPVGDETHAYALKGEFDQDLVVLAIHELTEIPVDQIKLRFPRRLP